MVGHLLQICIVVGSSTYPLRWLGLWFFLALAPLLGLVNPFYYQPLGLQIRSCCLV